ncbi:soluble lytic murein transglycosylase [Inhella inkyongensis]|uniref:Soluble lytic murein transglycosylase n=1 Tax=Inhella inkyongensis TaxID=392593 RepID=A0A840S150_9BURK|nr:lytic transglycosylase domain-containing protein [Inhella inkyongensis]MBB5203128.1 soluble lytic murein transglycosylase [Inhella inkyongensis]
MRELKYRCRRLAALCVAAASASAALAQTPDALMAEAQAAWKKRDRAQLSVLAERAQAQAHPLASWVDYWRQFSALPSAQVADLESFYQRWPGSYVEDRLRNDWLLELGRRQDWTAFAADYPRFRMDDDREVHCHALSAELALGRALKPSPLPLKERALQAWLAQKDADEGCHAMAKTLVERKVFGSDELRLKINRSVEASRAKAFKQTLELLRPHEAKSLNEAYEKPSQYLTRSAHTKGRWHQEEAAVALVRLSVSSTERLPELMRERWAAALSPGLQQWVWAQAARQAGFRLQADAADFVREAFAVRQATRDWSEDSLTWAARAALRANAGAGDWPLLRQVIEGMPESLRQESGWRYWLAQARYRAAPEGETGEPQRHAARGELLKLAHPLHFYGQLAAEELGQRLPLPAAPAPLSEAERQRAAGHAGLNRALLLIQQGLRGEGVREWNFSLRGMDDRELLAAAQRACEAEVWDRCINTSERTKTQIDLAQRYPTPFREQMLAQARTAGLDPADPYGLMRQESRFINGQRSHAGAGGLMQVMPATARWTAKKLGLAYAPEKLQELDFNLRVGMGYFRLVLDDFGGALPLAAAAYNAGPGRPRRWREGAELDAAAWAEVLPFHETRDYVQKVVSNATVYARLLGREQATLRERLGLRIGPRPAGAPPANLELPRPSVGE